MPDFRLEDVWALPTPGRADEFPLLIEGLAAANPAEAPSRAARARWSLRCKLGDLLGLDGSGWGSTEGTPLRKRLPDDLRERAGRISRPPVHLALPDRGRVSRRAGKRNRARRHAPRLGS